MTWHTIEPRTRKYVEGYGILSFARKYKNLLMDTGLDALKTAFEKVLYKTVEFLRNKIVDAVTKRNNKIVKPKACNSWKAKKC